VLFGEDYKRGEFLVNLKEEYRKADLSWGSELPDHLPYLLLLISETKEKDFVEELCWCLLIPALKEMIRNFRSETNVYKGLLQMLLVVLETDFQHVPYEQYQINTDVKAGFLDCIGCSSKKSKKPVKTF
jgi:nitrate reductase assembly molybdenum cofactor insertion protein NarJ